MQVLYNAINYYIQVLFNAIHYYTLVLFNAIYYYIYGSALIYLMYPNNALLVDYSERVRNIVGCY